MHKNIGRMEARKTVIGRKPKGREKVRSTRMTEIFGENVFDLKGSPDIPASVIKNIMQLIERGEQLDRDHVDIIAQSAARWAISKGATHFCHWFQPLTGSTAEKHDSFLNFDENLNPIEELSSAQLVQGEPDASSFPNGGARSTFEARGYTAWDTTSPMFLMEGENGKTLCIPTAFVSYNGDALDIKTPLLRSLTKLSEVASIFLNLTTDRDIERVEVTCGAEQEYFLIDKAFFFERPDLVMSRKTLFGSLSTKNQQLSDHYFGTVPDRVLAFMQELDHELYRLGIPSKTRHNEVAPGQFEIAPIFTNANLSADHNQIIMAMLNKIADRHDFVALMHEKPFHGVNGSGKHLNWSLRDSKGKNLLSPGKNPHENYIFLAMVAMTLAAVDRHAEMMRLSVAGAGNDHRLGGSEAPPSILSVYLGDQLTKILQSMSGGTKFSPEELEDIDFKTTQLVKFEKDTNDRNRTSPFAFVGNRFEFRSCGSSQTIGFPLTILNAAFTDILSEACEFIISEQKAGVVDKSELLKKVVAKFYRSSSRIVFNGDGYTKEWEDMAKKRGLPNYATTVDVLPLLKNDSYTRFLLDSEILSHKEIDMRYNVMIENYVNLRRIELSTFAHLVTQRVLPVGVNHKMKLAQVIRDQKEIGVKSSSDIAMLKEIILSMDSLYELSVIMKKELEDLGETPELKAKKIEERILPMAKQLSIHCDKLEDVLDDQLWALPKYFDMLFVR